MIAGIAFYLQVLPETKLSKHLAILDAIACPESMQDHRYLLADQPTCLHHFIVHTT